MIKLLWVTWDFTLTVLAILATLLIAFVSLPINPGWASQVADEVAGLTEEMLK